MRIVELMIIVMAAALGFAQMRWNGHREPSPSLGPRVTVALMELAPLTFSASVAYLAIVARHSPRPRRTVCDRPGFAGVLAVVLAVGLLFPFDLAMLLMRTGGEFEGAGIDYWWPTAVEENLSVAGGAVVAVWGNLIAAGRWRPERTWVDRLGRMIAGCWLITAIAHRVFWG